MSEYVVAVDLAQRRDWTWWLVLRDNVQVVDGSSLSQRPDRIQHYYDIVFLDKAQNAKYGDIVKATDSLMMDDELRNNADLIIDGTGVGVAVRDMMVDAHLNPIPIMFTAGDRVHEVYHDPMIAGARGFRGIPALKQINVPKLDLVAAGRKLIETHRVGVCPGIDYAKDFERQMKSFHEILKENKHLTFEAATGDHDDAVCAFLMAAWWTTYSRPKDRERERERPIHTRRAAPADWNPLDYLN